MPAEPNSVADANIQNGQVVREGAAAEAFGHNGGGTQYELRGDIRTTFSNPRSLEPTILPLEGPSTINPETLDPIEPVEPFDPFIEL